MPLEAMTADQPSTGPGYADTLAPNIRPALSATSDMPVRTALAPAETDPVAEPVDNVAEAVDDSAPAADSAAEPDAGAKETGDEGKSETPAWQKARLSRERNQRQAAEARAEKLASQLEQALAGIAELTKKPADERPQRDRFETPEAYDAALEAFASRRAAEAAKAEAKAEQDRNEQVRRLDEVRSSYKARADAFAETHEDYYDLVDADDAGFTLPMTAAILETEDGPAVAYHLAQHPEMIERIAKLSQVQMVFEIGRIAQRLATPPAPKPKPINTLAGRSTPAEKTPEEMTMDEYAAHKRAKRAAN